MKRCGQTHGRDLQYTGTAQHNSRIHQVRCFYDEKDGTRPAPEVGEEQEGEGRIMDAFNKSIAYISNKFPGIIDEEELNFHDCFAKFLVFYHKEFD